MVDMKAKGRITAGRDMNIADRGSTIHLDTRKAAHGGNVNAQAQKSANPIIRLLQAALDIVKWWRKPPAGNGESP